MKEVFRSVSYFHSKNPKALLRGILELNLSVATLILDALIPYLRKEHFQLLEKEYSNLRGGFFGLFETFGTCFAQEITARVFRKIVEPTSICCKFSLY